MQWKRNITCAFAALMLFCPWSEAAEAAIKPLMITAQAGKFAMNAEKWQPQEVTGDCVAFAAADLDDDGTMDLLVMEWAGRAVYSSTEIYVLQDDGPAEAPIQNSPASRQSWISIDFALDDEIHRYQDPKDGSIWYAGVDAAHGKTKKFAFCLKDGVVYQKLLGWMTYDYEANDGGQRLYYDMDGKRISAKAWDKLEERYFKGMKRQTMSFAWIYNSAYTYKKDWQKLSSYAKRSQLYRNYERNEKNMAWQ